MANFGNFPDLSVELGDDYVAEVCLQRPPNNFFDRDLIAALGDAFEALDAETGCRAAVLASEGKNFCAGANFGKKANIEESVGNSLYDEAVRLFATRTPVVAAVQGAAIGGGLGLALFPDFRVCSEESRFSANFARLGIHQGFGISVTLPRVVGQQRATEMLYTGARLNGRQAFDIGLADRLVALEEIGSTARALAREIAGSAPLAVDSIRQTFRKGLPEEIRAATAHEKAEQDRLQLTEDFKEGIRAMADRRPPNFQSR